MPSSKSTTRPRSAARSFLRIVTAAAVALMAFTPMGVAHAAGDVGGTVWLGFNGDTTYDKGVNHISPFADVLPPSVVEKGFEGIAVRLLDAGGNEVATTTTDADGKYSFPGVDDGKYVVEMTAPENFGFVSETPDGDSDVSAPQPAGTDPWIGTSPVTVAGGAVEVDAGLRPMPQLTLGPIDIDGDPANGVQGIKTGKEPFNIPSDCPGPGMDCEPFDDVVRSNDLVTLNLGVSASDLATGGEVDNVIVELRLIPKDGAILGIESASQTGLPSSCIGNGPPESTITTDPATGVVTLACNIGSVTNEIALLPMSVFADASSPNGSSFTWEARSYSASDEAMPSDKFDGGPSTKVTSSPRYDLTKNNDRSNPHNRAIQYSALEERVNPVTGETEMGKTISYDLSLIIPKTPLDPAHPEGPFFDNRGIEKIGDFSFTELVDPRYAPFGATIVGCSPNPYLGTGGSTLPTNGEGNKPYEKNKTVNNGTWKCPAGSNTVTVTGSDTTGKHLPKEGQQGNSLLADIVTSGSVQVWYPASAFFRYAGPDGDITTEADNGTTDGTTPIAGTDPADWGKLWQYGDKPNFGTYPTTNCVTDFDPKSATGSSNFGTGFEPGWDGTAGGGADGNNCRNTSVTISRGTFGKAFGGTVEPTGLDAYWTGRDAHIVPAQSANGSGDGPVVADQKFFAQLVRNNQGGAAPLSGIGMCDAIDNATYHVTPLSTGPFAGKYTQMVVQDFVPKSYSPEPGTYKNAYENGFMVEYARFTGAQKTWQNDYHMSDAPSGIQQIRPIDTSQQDAASRDCGEALTKAGKLEWTADPSGWSADDIVMVRVVGDPNADMSGLPNPKLKPGEVDSNDALWVNINLQARTKFYAPDQPAIDGMVIPTGTLLPNHARVMYDWLPDKGMDSPGLSYGTGGYDPTDHKGIDGSTTVGYGDRLIYRGVRITLDKTADLNDTGDNKRQEAFAGDPIKWSLTPKVTDNGGTGIARNLQVKDVMPEFMEYDPSCSPALPDGVTGPEIAFDTPNPGETTLTWSLGDRKANTPIDPIILCTRTSSFIPAPIDLLNHADITANNATASADSRSIRILQVGRLAVEKKVDYRLDELNDAQVWTLRWANTTESSSPIVFAPVDVIDTLPYNGDDSGPSGRTRYASHFTGTLQLTGPMPAPQRTLKGGTPVDEKGTWYYTADAPDTVNHDAHDPENKLSAAGTTNWCSWDGAAFNLVGGSGSCPGSWADVTAIRFASTDNLPSQAVVTAELTVQADGNERNDFYVNRFGGYTDTFPKDAVLSNEPFVQVVGFSVGDLIWIDTNGDNKYTEGIDQPIADGTAVELYAAGATPGTDAPVATTKVVDGRYLFEGMSPGDYFVVVPKVPANLAAAPNAKPANDDVNEGIDHSATATGNGGIKTDVFTLSYTRNGQAIHGDEPVGDNVAGIGDPFVQDHLTNFTIDLALVGTLSIGDRVWVDEDGDGVQDPGEPGIPGVTVKVTWLGADGKPGGGDDVVFTTTTDADGKYKVENLAPGDYSVSISNLAPEFESTFDLDSGTKDPDRTTMVKLTESRTDVDFGERVTFSLGDRVWVDVDGDGKYDAGTDKPAPEGTKIELMNADGTPTGKTTTTDANGNYKFTGLAAGEYYVVIPSDALVGKLARAKAAPNGVADPNNDADEAADHNAIDDPAGGIKTGVIKLSATYSDTPGAQVTGDEPDGFTNNTLDLALAIEPAAPAIEVTKYVQGDDANDAPGVMVAVGQDVVWSFKVVNTGNVELTDVSVSDKTLTDAGAKITCPADKLPVGESMECTASPVKATAGQQTNTATASGKGPETYDAAGNPVPGETVTDDDPANYFGAEPAIDVEKYVVVDGVDHDADAAPGPSLTVGSVASWKIVVTNSGNVPLTDVAVEDPKMAALGATIKCAGGNPIAKLEVGAVVECTVSAKVVEAGVFTNTASATGTPPETTGPDGKPFTPEKVTDNDPANYNGEKLIRPQLPPETGAAGAELPVTGMAVLAAAGLALLGLRRRTS